MNVPGCQIFIGIKIKTLKWLYYIHHHLDTRQVLGVFTSCWCRLVSMSRVTKHQAAAAAAAAVSCKNQGGSVLLQPPANTRLQASTGDWYFVPQDPGTRLRTCAALEHHIHIGTELDVLRKGRDVFHPARCSAAKYRGSAGVVSFTAAAARVRCAAALRASTN